MRRAVTYWFLFVDLATNECTSKYHHTIIVRTFSRLLSSNHDASAVAAETTADSELDSSALGTHKDQ